MSPVSDEEVETMPYRVESEDGEPRIIYTPPRLDPEALKATVFGILDGDLFPSAGVPEELVLTVFMPLALGGLRPPPEIVEEHVGRRPELIDEEPPAPPEPLELPPEPAGSEKPEAVPYNEDLRSDVEWGDADEEEWLAHKAEVDLENERILDEYHQKLDSMQDVFERWEAECDAMSLAHQAAEGDFNRACDELEARKKVHEALDEEWCNKYQRIASRWTADVGVLIGDMAKAAPRSVNGYPIFFAFTVLHREDWERVHKAVMREVERRDSVEI